MAQPFIPVNGQAGLDQTANKLYVRDGGGRGSEKEIKTEIWVHTLSHTHSSRFFQQNPWKEPMTAGTEAADKKNISNDEEASLHSIPLCKVQRNLTLYLDRKKTQQATWCWVLWIKNTSHHLVSYHSLTHHLGLKTTCALKWSTIWKDQ